VIGDPRRRVLIGLSAIWSMLLRYSEAITVNAGGRVSLLVLTPESSFCDERLRAQNVVSVPFYCWR